MKISIKESFIFLHNVDILVRLSYISIDSYFTINKFLVRRLAMIIFSRPALFIILSGMMLSLSFSVVAADDVSSIKTVKAPDIKRVVLYKHGMGYIERQEEVVDDVTFSMFFRDKQMNDLLTSFYAIDMNGGKIASVLYETEKPASQRKQGIMIKIPEHAALSELLVQLKGAVISAKTADETIKGRVLGVEPINEIVAGRDIKADYKLVLLTNKGIVRFLNLSSLIEYNIENETLKRDLNKLLDISLDSKYANRKRMTLTARGKGKRELRIGYLVGMPIWKCSYRVIFDKNKKDAALLQGWAQAENNSEDDWNDIEISFVAGNPLSYVMDMYTPLYIKRPHVPIPGLQDLQVDWSITSSPEGMKKRNTGKGINSRQYKPAYKTREVKSSYANVPQMMDSIGVANEAYPSPDSDEKSMGELLSESVGAQASGTKVGELFSYELDEKISIPRGEAAMIPILTTQIDGKRLLYYKKAFSSKVMNAFVLQNNTNLTLDAGAVSFYEGNTSLGEGILGHTLTSGSQEVIPYAITASVDVTPQLSSDRSSYFKGKVVNGILTLTCVETLTNKWKIANRGKEPVVIWLNQPKNSRYKLSKPEKPLKEVDNHYRFEIKLNPEETKTFAVEEKRDVNKTVMLNTANEKTIAFYASQKYISKDTQKFLSELSGLMSKKTTYQRQIAEWQRQIEQLSKKQKRLRENIRMLNSRTSTKEKNLRAAWVDTLAESENSIGKLRVKIDSTYNKVVGLETEIANKIKNFKM